jgi:chromosome partitioning protein
MARLYAIANQKGGVGKSTTAVNVAAYLGEWGRRVLLVDLDPQGNATSGLGVFRDADRPNVYRVLIEGNPARDAILTTGAPGLDLLPSDISLAGAEIELIGLPRRESRLLYALDGLAGSYDYIFVDCPPSLGLLTVNALVAARHLVVPIQCEFYALEGLGHLSYTLDLIRQQWNPGLELAGIVMTLYDSRTTLSAQVVEEVRGTYPEIIFKTLIPRNVRLSEAPSYGIPIGQYSPRSRGGLAYAELTRELMARAEGGAPEGAANAVDVGGAERTSDRAEAAAVVPADAGTSSAGPSANDDIGPELSAEAPEGIIDG